MNAPANDPSDEQPRLLGSGLRLGRYRLLFELASGGMANVYLARAEGAAGFGKLVAIKRTHKHLSRDEEFVRMFLDEAQLTSRISHPNVCSVFDFGEVDGEYFLAMDFLLGETLQRVVKAAAKQSDAMRARFPKLAIRMIADACEGLHAAHELRGDDGAPLHLVHRDVSPHNLFVNYDGSVRVVDFGIARAVGRLTSTASGLLKGKFGYMAPEAFKRLPLDRRADVWALGVCLWELLTLKRLFRREDQLETLAAVVNDPIPAPSSVNPNLPAALDAIILKALDRDRDTRYATARDFARALHRFLSTDPEGTGIVDVADWMGEVFATDLARKQELIAFAQREEVGKVPQVSSQLYQHADATSDVTDKATVAAASSGVVRAPARRRGAMIATAVLLCVGGVGVTGFVATREDPASPVARSAPDPAPPMPAAAPLDEPRAFPAPVPPPAAPAVVEAAEPEPSPATRAGARPVRAPASTPRQAPSSAPEVRAAPSSAPEVRATSDATGLVNVATPNNWANIFRGDERLGRSPTRLTLPVGHHTLRLVFGTGDVMNVEVDVAAGETSRVVVRPP